MSYLKINSLLRNLRSNDYVVYTQPQELNLVATRNNTVRSEQFDDKLTVFWKDEAGNWQLREYLVTTDPSVYYLDNPIVPQGYGFIKKGQYIKSYQIGLHKGRKALTQTKPIPVIRNYDLKGLFKKYTGTEQVGIFGNNIHDMKGSMINASAGCIVFAEKPEYDEFLALCDTHRAKYGNSFTLTLLDFRDKNKARNTAIAAGLLTVASAGFAVTMGTKRKKA